MVAGLDRDAIAGVVHAVEVVGRSAPRAFNAPDGLVSLGSGEDRLVDSRFSAGGRICLGLVEGVARSAKHPTTIERR
jgi:hypothetical protein